MDPACSSGVPRGMTHGAGFAQAARPALCVTKPVRARQLSPLPRALLVGLLLALLGPSPAPVRAGSCASHAVDTFIDVGGRQIVPLGSVVTVQFGLDAFDWVGGQRCRRVRTAVPVAVELTVAARPEGPHDVLSAGPARTAAWTPARPGPHWLRATARSEDGQLHQRTLSLLVADGTVLVDAGGRQVRASLQGPGTKESPITLELAASASGQIALPKAPAWWLLAADGGPAWVHVEADGTAARTLAPGSLRIQVPEGVPQDWEITASAPGAPIRTLRCEDVCTLDKLPLGPVQLRVRPSHLEAAPVPLSLTVRSPRDAVSLCAMGLLAGAGPLFGACGAASAPLRAQEKTPADACHGARPYDGAEGPVAVGRAVCVRRAEGWEPWTAPPAAAARGTLTAAARVGSELLWTEEGNQGMGSRLLLFAAGKDGVRFEAIPHRRPDGAICTPRSITAGPDGAPILAGSCQEQRSQTASGGFIARRTRTQWSLALWRTAIHAARRSSGRLLAVDADGALLDCTAQCRAVARAGEPLLGLFEGEDSLRAIGRSGAVHAFDGKRLRQLLPAPGFGPPISQIIESTAGPVALFGPVIKGSEYHPFCVTSVVALLRAEGWRELHGVRGRDGRALDCQDDDARAVATEIAAAGELVYARRRARFAGVSAVFSPLAPLR